MTAFYTIVGFAPQPFTKMTDGGHGYSSRSHRPRTYETLNHARRMQTRMRKNAPEGVTYTILETVIYPDGVPTTNWVE